MSAKVETKNGKHRVSCDACQIITGWISAGTEGMGAEQAWEIMYEHNTDEHGA